MIDAGLLLLAGFLLAGRRKDAPPILTTEPALPKSPSQVPFPVNTPLPTPVAPAPRGGPLILPEIVITPTPQPAPASAALPPPPPPPKTQKRAVEVWRVAPSNHGRSVADMKAQFPAGWQPSHPPSGSEIAKAQSLLPAWRPKGLHWDQSASGTAGVRAYWYRLH